MGRSGRRRMHDPSFSHRRPFFGCLCGTFSPSRRQIRSTPLHVHRPARVAEQRGDPAIAVAAVLAGERDDVGGQRLFVRSAPRHLPLRRAMLPQHAAGDTFRHAELPADVVDAGPAAGGAQ